MSLIKNSTCKIIVETQGGIFEEKGTGFFISKNQILTCRHVIENLTGEIKIQKCHNQNERELTAQIISSCTSCDYALLQLKEDFENVHFLELCDSEIVEEENIEIFGYPNDEQGQVVGERLIGKVERILDDPELAQDVSLEISNFAPNTKYDAFSGSPVINDYNQVISIVKYQAVRNLSSVSVRKAKLFLEENTIDIRPDQLQSFENYKEVFNLYPEDIKNDCETHSSIIMQSFSPNKIVYELADNLFYPKKNKDVTEIIKELRSNKDLNNSIWKGWIKLLTYVNMIKGDHTEVNHIKFNLSEIDINELFGDEITMEGKVSISLKLSFYFTEGKSFFQIARTFIQMENNQQQNSCSIFNSNEENFTFKKFSNADKVKIIPNIAGDVTSAFKIEEKIHIGVLSLYALSEQIVNSSNLNDISVNIEKLLLDAIK